MSYWVKFTTREDGVETLHNIRWITVRQMTLTRHIFADFTRRLPTGRRNQPTPESPN